MLQVVQNYRSGQLKLQDVPIPMLQSGGAIVRTCYSLVSVGTERATLEMSRKNILGKARQRPDLARQVLATVQKTGVRNTIDLVMSRLNAPVPLGYSLCGVVESVAHDVTGVEVGDLVACAGAGYANHAERVFVPKNLMVPVPENVAAEEAAFTTLGSIALHGVRQANVHLGDKVGVIGLGLVGQLTAGLLKAQGCRVLAVDLNAFVVDLSKQMGVDVGLLRDEPDLIETVRDFTDGIGLDAVIITAGTSSNDAFELAAEIMRDKGTLVVVGGIKMEILKSVSSDFYRKEIDVKFSRSYGPGRYDPHYEEKGIDYPVGYVRWTENRNMRCFLELLASGRLCLRSLITDIIPFEEAIAVYETILQKNGKPHVGILLKYGDVPRSDSGRVLVRNAPKPAPGAVGIGMIGAGKFAQANILPYLRKHADVVLKGVCTSRGLTARNVAERFGFDYCAHDPNEVLNDADVAAVFIATRHDSHAQYVIEALKKGKHVYVEKPLCIARDELAGIVDAYRSALRDRAVSLMVGYNRRFSPLGIRLKEFFLPAGMPVTVTYRVNAGYMAGDNWYQDPAQGGRFVGEGGHFIDFVMFLTDATPVRVNTFAPPNSDRSAHNDNLTVTLQMSDGSVATIVYNSSGAPSMPKERIEVLGAHSSAVLEDFKSLHFFKANKKWKIKHQQDKGYGQEVSSCIDAISRGGDPLIPFEDLIAVSLTTFAAMESLQSKTPVSIDRRDCLTRMA